MNNDVLPLSVGAKMSHDSVAVGSTRRVRTAVSKRCCRLSTRPWPGRAGRRCFPALSLAERSPLGALSAQLEGQPTPGSSVAQVAPDETCGADSFGLRCSSELCEGSELVQPLDSGIVAVPQGSLN